MSILTSAVTALRNLTGYTTSGVWGIAGDEIATDVEHTEPGSYRYNHAIVGADYYAYRDDRGEADMQANLTLIVTMQPKTADLLADLLAVIETDGIDTSGKAEALAAHVQHLADEAATEADRW